MYCSYITIQKKKSLGIIGPRLFKRAILIGKLMKGKTTKCNNLYVNGGGFHQKLLENFFSYV